MFIGRRADTTIYGLWTVRQFDGQEELADDDTEIVAFRTPKVPTQEELDTQGRTRIQDDKLLRALIVWLAGRFGITVAQARDEIVTIYKGL